MIKDIYYVCENTEELEGVIKTFYTPLFEDIETKSQVPNLNIYGVWGLMDMFCGYGERTYYKLNVENIEEMLVKAINIEVIRDESIILKYTFEDGSTYEGFIEDYYDWREGDIESLIAVAKEAVHHVFFLKCELTSEMLDFYTELWG